MFFITVACFLSSLLLWYIPSEIISGIKYNRFWKDITATLWQNLRSFLIPSSLACILIGFVFGSGTECLKHFYLRACLTFHYKIPWNLAKFLTYCHDRRLLQQIGGRYRFIHRELLDHFAGKEA